MEAFVVNSSGNVRYNPLAGPVGEQDQVDVIDQEGRLYWRIRTPASRIRLE
jgi:hypothetical protein